MAEHVRTGPTSGLKASMRPIGKRTSKDAGQKELKEGNHPGLPARGGRPVHDQPMADAQ